MKAFETITIKVIDVNNYHNDDSYTQVDLLYH